MQQNTACRDLQWKIYKGRSTKEDLQKASSRVELLETAALHNHALLSVIS